MQRIKDTQIYYAVLRGKSNQQLFEEEIQKMKILDAAANARNIMDVQILAYCVLDNELHLVLQTEKERADDFLNRVEQQFEETCLRKSALRIDYLSEQYQFPKVNSSVREQGIVYSENRNVPYFRKNRIKDLKDMKTALRCCLKLHMMPVRQKIVSDPEDYWWSSYLDYMGRQWLPIANPICILSLFGDNTKQAIKLIRERHQKMLAKLKASNLV